MPRAIPDFNLATPVLIAGNYGGFGSGFFMNADERVYLITARHVLIQPGTINLKHQSVTLTSYSPDLADPTPNTIVLDLHVLAGDSRIIAHPTSDVAVIRLATKRKEDGRLDFFSGIRLTSTPRAGLLLVSTDAAKRFDDVLVSNPVIIFGYPRSLGLQQTPQFDYDRPLLRSGIVAGKNLVQKTVVLDCPVYPGNSGGIVMEIEQDGVMNKFRAIEVVSEFVPFRQPIVPVGSGLGGGQAAPTHIGMLNSGYSIASPMDSVLELVV